MVVRNQVQLITYPDSLGGNLGALKEALDGKLKGLFPGGIHLLPPFPSSGDRGFAPLTYYEIEPEFGTWEDIRNLGEQYDILVDLMVNHISRQSKFFQDFLEKGKNSEYSDLFITLDKLWDNGEPDKDDVSKMFLRRERPYSSYRVEATGELVNVFTTFGKTEPSEQIDLDIHSPRTRQLLSDIFHHFKENHIKIVRLDAVGYVIKKMGTSCFFVEPEIYEFLDWIKELADGLQMELLPEVHDHYSTQYKLSEHGFWIYDFILPYRILEALTFHNSKALVDYLGNRPQKQFTMLDCHDGVPVMPDLNELFNPTNAMQISELCAQRGSTFSRVLSDEHKGPGGFDVHQIRGTFYSLLGGNDDAYLAARAIQFFTPGIPQVYYVGLMAGENDQLRVEQYGDGREANRHNYTMGEIDEAVNRSVVQRLFKLIRFRNEYEAFQGEFSILKENDYCVKLHWKKALKECTLYIDLESFQSNITYTQENGENTFYPI